MPEKLRCKYCSSFKHSEFWNVRKCKQNHFASCSEWQQIPTTVFYYNNHTHSQWPKTVFLFFTFALLIFHLCSSLNVKKHLRYMSICQHLTADGNNDSPCCITCRHCYWLQFAAIHYWQQQQTHWTLYRMFVWHLSLPCWETSGVMS